MSVEVEEDVRRRRRELLVRRRRRRRPSKWEHVKRPVQDFGLGNVELVRSVHEEMKYLHKTVFILLAYLFIKPLRDRVCSNNIFK